MKEQKPWKPLVYVAHPFGGLIKNQKKIDRIMEKLVFNDDKHVYVSPIHNFGFAYLDGDEYQRGLDVCLELLKKCDILVICPGWENSKGCKQEVKLAIDNNIPVFLLENWKQEVLMDNELEPYYDFMERRKIEEMECYSE